MVLYWGINRENIIKSFDSIASFPLFAHYLFIQSSGGLFRFLAKPSKKDLGKFMEFLGQKKDRFVKIQK